MKKIIQLIAISIILLALPAASWYFLKSGLDYRKESLNKLGDYGTLTQMDLDVKGKNALSVSDLEGNTILVQNLDTQADTTLTMKLFRQFEKRADMKFIVTAHPQLKIETVRKDNLWQLEKGKGTNEFFKSIGLEEDNKVKVALIDREGIIKNYYSLSDESELRQLVEHTAFILPVEETAKPELKRYTEK